MGRITFRRFYTEIVEHYFRMAIRNDSVKGDTPQEWFLFTRTWLGTQSESDREFLQFVFSKEYRNPVEGIYCYHRREPYHEHRVLTNPELESSKRRLSELERRFAIAGGLITEETTGFERY